MTSRHPKGPFQSRMASVLLASAVTTTFAFVPSHYSISSHTAKTIDPTSLLQPKKYTGDISITSPRLTILEEGSSPEKPLEENQEAEINVSDEETTTKKKYVIVGGGWGGWGAAKAICESGLSADVTLIDALPDPTGQTPYLSATGKPVEAGTRGFWKDYPNINKLCEELGLDESDVFTKFTNSSFYSPEGLECTAPVFSEATVDSILGGLPLVDGFTSSVENLFGSTLLKNGSEKSKTEFPMLPSPLGQILASTPYFERLPVADRSSMVGLLLATIDCLGGDEATQEAYDRMTAHELFLRFKVSDRLVNDFLKPTLLVGLFKPPEELSALVVMELLYYYALAHQDSFDVRWIKKGTVSDSLIKPLSEKLMQEDHGGLNVLGGCRVKEISLEGNANGGGKLQATKLTYFDTRTGETNEINDIDGIVLALGCQGMQSVVSCSPDLAKLPVFSLAAGLKGIDVISCRLWLDRKVPTRSPANVFSRFEGLRGAGGTFFMLDQLQEDNIAELWGEDGASDENDEIPRGSVVACDFYNAGGLLSLKDEDIVKTLTDELLPSAVPQFADAKLVDFWVGKYPGTVSWFAPGTYSRRPPLEGAGNNILPNLKCAGDWVRMGEREHGAKGLCQERAFVSGFEAANSLMKSTTDGKGEDTFKPHEVLAVREDELQFKLGIEVNRKVMKYLPRFWIR